MSIKISQLQQADPLTGDEIIPIVQGNPLSTKQISVSSLCNQGLIGEFIDSNKIYGAVNETTVISYKIPSNTYKVNDILSFGPSVLFKGVYSSILSGWYDLSNILSRTFDTFIVANNYAIGNNVLSLEFIMKHTESNRYWRIKFLSWGKGGDDGSFSYERTEINPTTGEDIGSTVFFNRPINEDITDVIIPGELEIRRGDSGPIYNSAIESGSDSDSPKDTIWNSKFTEDFTGECIFRIYVSNSEGGMDNLIYHSTQNAAPHGTSDNTWDASGFTINVNNESGFNSLGTGVSGWSFVLSQITSPTEITLFENLMLKKYTIPNITQDIYFTLTVEVDNEEIFIEPIFVSVIKNLIDFQLFVNEFY